ncbi:MAG: hypothetical protein KKA07_08405, partial [Bacteroidetes bacterium]|nr:hypothetical protein [Bacteroidota bacterium]
IRIISVLLCLLLAVGAVSAQDTIKTLQRTEVTTTGVSLIPPVGYVQLPEQNNFMSTSSFTIIQVNSFTDKSYSESNADKYLNAHIEDKGLTLNSRKKIQLANGKEAILYNLTITAERKGQTLTFEKVVLLAGDDTKLVWIDSVFPAEKKGMVYRDLYDSILTTEFK